MLPNTFPRTLNAIRCLEEVEAGMKKSQPVETKKAKTEAYSVPPKEEIIDQLKKLGGAVMPLGDINPYNKYFTGTTIQHLPRSLTCKAYSVFHEMRQI